MGVYVDNMRMGYGRMVMCHMIADTTEELLAMRERLGIAHVPLEDAGTYREHLDVCRAKRALAVAAGAVEVTMRELGGKLAMKRLLS